MSWVLLALSNLELSRHWPLLLVRLAGEGANFGTSPFSSASNKTTTLPCNIIDWALAKFLGKFFVSNLFCAQLQFWIFFNSFLVSSRLCFRNSAIPTTPKSNWWKNPRPSNRRSRRYQPTIAWLSQFSVQVLAASFRASWLPSWRARQLRRP